MLLHPRVESLGIRIFPRRSGIHALDWLSSHAHPWVNLVDRRRDSIDSSHALLPQLVIESTSPVSHFYQNWNQECTEGKRMEWMLGKQPRNLHIEKETTTTQCDEWSHRGINRLPVVCSCYCFFFLLIPCLLVCKVIIDWILDIVFEKLFIQIIWELGWCHPPHWIFVCFYQIPGNPRSLETPYSKS